MLLLPGRRAVQYIKPSRLGDVMALIQVLALHGNALRSETGVAGSVGRGPHSAQSWVGLALEHPEFFSVDEKNANPLSLVARRAMPRNPAGHRKRLSPEFTADLLKAAIDLHDRQIRRSERWTYFVPIWVAVIVGVASLLAALIKGCSVRDIFGI